MRLVMHISLTELHALKQVKNAEELAKAIPAYGDRCLMPDGTGQMFLWINTNFEKVGKPLALGDVVSYPISIEGD